MIKINEFVSEPLRLWDMDIREETLSRDMVFFQASSYPRQ